MEEDCPSMPAVPAGSVPQLSERIDLATGKYKYACLRCTDKAERTPRSPKRSNRHAATVPARLEFVRIHPWTRLCNALAPNAHTVLPVSNPRPDAPAAHAMTAATMPKHPLAWRLHAPPTDAQRREAVAKRLLRYADATHGRFAYPLQVLLDTDLVKRHDPTALLKWLVGVTSATRYRITAHPPTDFRMKPAWISGASAT